jgi:NADH-quinone oxidoreductase subunit J
MNIQQIIFWFFSVALIGSGVMVVTARNPVRAVMFLVLAFITSSALWMMLQAEFLSLVLVFVYVGAVMTLFLFVVMMINIDLASLKQGFVRYLPLGIIVSAFLAGLILYVLTPKHFPTGVDTQMVMQPANYSNTKDLGSVLYTEYVYPFEIAAAILLVAIVSAISLAFRGRQNSKSQNISEQIAVQKKDRYYVVNLRQKKS